MKNNRNELTITMAGIVSYAICMINNFHTDDWLVLFNYSNGLSWMEFLSMENLGRFRPLTNILLYFRYLAFGENAALYYGLNIALHIAVCILLYRFLLKMGLSRAASLVSALIFTVYFQHYEAVLWLYGTIRILAAAFWILSLWALRDYILGGRLRSLAIFAAVSISGLFIVEDFVVAPLGFAVFVMIFAERKYLWKRLIPVAMIGAAGLAIYFALRATLIARPQIVEEYYYFGPHIITRLAAYFGWMAIPPPDHPYFQKLSSHLSPVIYNTWDALSFAFMLGLIAYSIYLIFRAPKLVSFFAFFIFLTLLPALPLNYKVTSRNIYLPSIGLSVILAYLLERINERFKARRSLNRLIHIGAGALAIVSVISIWVTSLEYKKNQMLVASMISDIKTTGVDLSNCKFVLLDHMPGRTIIGPTMVYRFGYTNDVVASNDPVYGPIDIRKALKEIRLTGEPFAVFDYRNGHLVDVTGEYILHDAQQNGRGVSK